MVKPFKGWVVFFFVFTFLGILSWAAAPFAVRDLINNLADNGRVTDTAWKLVALYTFLRLLDEWFWRYAESRMRRIKPRAIERMRYLLFEYTLQKPYSFFVNASSGQLGHWINETTKTLNDMVETTIWAVWPQVMGLLLSAIFLFIANWILAVIFIVWLVGLFSFTLYRGRIFSKMIEKESQARSRTSGQIVDAMSNHLSVRVFNSRDRELEMIDKRQERIRYWWDRSWRFNTHTNIVKGHSVALVSAVGMSVILWLYSRGQITVGDVALFLTYFTAAANSIWELAWQLDSYYRSFGIIANGLKGLGKGAPERDGAKELPLPQQSTIELKKLGFSYPDQPDMKVLRNVTLSVKEGERIGLVGHSGAGKTTLVSLLLGFYDPTEGEFYIGGTPVSHLTPSQMRDLIAFVPQDTNLFNRTVSENIAYARPGATQAEIKQAAKDAQALEFIERLPEGFETVIGERGVKLSGGQRQRIAIARALLKDSLILLLDEATSALDSVSEQAIQKAFSIAMKDRTAIVVAHRLSTLRHLDRIIVFEGGTIVEQGSHEELVDAGGVYADLWRRQKDGFIAE
jgi:ATP-binding cassette subfamily B protein